MSPGGVSRRNDDSVTAFPDRGSATIPPCVTCPCSSRHTTYGRRSTLDPITIHNIIVIPHLPSPTLIRCAALTTPSHHVFAKSSHKDVQLAEVGPRFEAKRE